jgi:pantetheine-phosphate adenylyltransferase
MTGIDTAFLLTKPEYSFISSSIVRDVMKNGGDYDAFVPKAVTV